MEDLQMLRERTEETNAFQGVKIASILKKNDLYYLIMLNYAN